MSSDHESPETARKTSGLKPWGKGVSGNPHGRRAKGLATAEKLRTALVKDLPEILATLVKSAKSGDINAARTILERVLPPLKAMELPVIVDGLEGTLSDQGQGILRAMAAGLLAPAQAAQLLGAIAAQAKIVEVDEFARRLEALEKRVAAGATGPATGQLAEPLRPEHVSNPDAGVVGHG